MNYTAVLSVMAGLVAFGLVSRKIADSIVTGPLLFAVFGVLAGPAVLGLVPLGITNEILHLLAEITLILVLFADAASIDLRQLRRDHDLPVRMLVIGMPLTIALGTGAAVLLFDGFGLWEAALLAAILAPTDAALGQAVVSNPAVPPRIRLTLNVESGLNDGIALPFVLIFAALASATEAGADTAHWTQFALLQVTLGPLAGIAVGYAGGKLVAASDRLGWLSKSAEGMIGIGLAFAAYAAAELVHGNGFIAAFVAGLTFGNTLKHKCEFLYEFAESEGLILILLTFLAYGCAMVPQALPGASAAVLVFAILALTVLRMLPVHLSLLGTGVRPVTSLFLGWFGPRGLASIVFLLLILEDGEIGNRGTIFAAVVVTVALSILLHGVSAAPAARRYASLTEQIGRCAENMPVSEEPFSDRTAEPGGNESTTRPGRPTQ